MSEGTSLQYAERVCDSPLETCVRVEAALREPAQSLIAELSGELVPAWAVPPISL